MKTVLVTGGAGYIGSHTVQVLLQKGYSVVVLDNLTTGHREAIDVLSQSLKGTSSEQLSFYHGDIADRALVKEIVVRHDVNAVIHFAAKSLVGESMQRPDLYFLENTGKSVQLFSTLQECGVRHIIFSSTAAVYGIPEQIPISETIRKQPVNPYGESKLMIEQSLRWMEEAYGVKWVALRYFNAAGASLNGEIGEDHDPETHLIPLVLKTALGQRESIHIFGTDYDTPDGTCIRDYIHVLDLAEAHVLALAALQRGMASGAWNVGTGNGYTVREVIEMARTVTGREIRSIEAERRAGDPAVLVADASLIMTRLNWRPKYGLRDMIESAWQWHVNRPEGYSEAPN
ncbi:UDP-glucose 4-epimerase GalE [Effusibacillus dendaii]|uniref:UDP-glucose 4-epimerase n=1 Tax=Effusibacillus dendaii TaxID=2743772 RepID=A0A7I8DCQ5_9BACL|nr:UDP-glucose 4-epimerase GalE [Effusibacillus dendaii]BCJ87807.1 UDP-glucose 4-epimerase GalE [Effusibacillus dendaii]